MSGTFCEGDILYVRRVEWQTIQPGDVIAFCKKNHDGVVSSIVHRVRACTPEGLVTQGDARGIPDYGFVRAEEVIGCIYRLERDGRVQRVLGGHWGNLWFNLLGFWRIIRSLLRYPYYLLRCSNLVQRIWRPNLQLISVNTQNGPLFKFLHRNRTVAYYCPQLQCFHCCKPYDLFITSPLSQENVHQVVISH